MKPKLTPLAVAALGLLIERPYHPYEMYRILITRRRDMLVKVRPASLYHAVETLERDGLVKSLGTDKVGNRPERTTYEITPKGRIALDEAVSTMLGTVAEEYPSFDFALSEAHVLPKGEVVALLKQRIVALSSIAGTFRGSIEYTVKENKPPVFTIGARYRLALIEREIELVESIRNDIISGAIAWPPDIKAKQQEEQA